jgi:hypothetical protein
VAVDSQGTPQVVFGTGALYTNAEVYHAKRDSAGWHLTNLSNSPDNNNYDVTTTVDAGGRACVVWQEVTPADELLMRTFDGRQWSPIQNITSDTSFASHFPQLAFPPGTGKLDLIWIARDLETAQVMYMGLSPVVSAIADDGCVRSAHQGPSFVARSLTTRSGRASTLLDISGRKVMALVPGPNDVRHLPAGVYFVRSEPSAVSREPSAVRKVVVTR